MHVPARIAAAILLALPAATAAPAARDSACPRGDAWSLSIDAERALERGAWPDAARDYACAARESTDAAVAERATRTAYDNLQLERAAESSRRWLVLAPDSEVARRYLATSLLRVYDEDGAAEQFAKLLETSYADRARGYLVLLGILSGEDNDTGAARVMDRLTAGDATLPEAQYAAAMLWQRAENGAKALAAAERALALRPDYPQAEFARVRALTTVGRRDEALNLSARLAATGDPFMQLSHAWQLLGEERREDATVLFEEIRRAGNGASADAASALASIAIDEERFEDAERLVDDAARDPEQAAGARWQRARIAEERGNKVDAARLYQAIDTGPRALGAQLRAHALLREEGAPEMAELLIDDYLDETPGDTVDVVSGVAASLVEEGRGDRGHRARRSRAHGAAGRQPAARARLPAGAARPGAGGRRRHAQGGGAAPERPDGAQCARLHARRPHAIGRGRHAADRARDRREARQLRDPGLDGLGARAGRPPRRGQVLARQGLGRLGRPGGRRAPRRDAVAHGTHRGGEEAVGRGARRKSRQPPAQARDRAPRAVTLRLAALSLVLLAGGCATLPAPAPGDDWPARRAALQALDAWALDGRIAVAAGDDGFSGGFDWHQQGARADIALTGPMGGAAMDIRAEGERAVVTVGGESYEARTPRRSSRSTSARTGSSRSCRCVTGSSARRPRTCRTRKRWVRTGGSRRCRSPAGRFATTATSRSEDSRCRRALEMTAPGLRLRVVVSDWRLAP